MTYLELCKLTRQECGIQGEGLPASVLSQTGLMKKVVEWVRDADLAIQNAYVDWDFLWSEFVGSSTIDLATVTNHPTDLGKWDSESFVVDRYTSTAKELPTLDYKDWRRRIWTQTAQEPNAITIKPDNTLALSSIADAVYEIYGVYWKVPTLLAANDDVPVYPARFHRAIVARAKMFFFEDQEAWENYGTAKAEYDTWFAELEAFAAPGQEYRGRSEAEEMTVRPI